MKLDENFNQQDFTDWIEEFLPSFSIDTRKVDVPSSFAGVKSINTLGESGLNVRVYIIETDADPSRRKVGLATDSFNLLKNYASPNAIIAYYSKNAPLWRISLLTSTPIWNEGKIITKLSNPKRQSYVLGSKAKIKTPYQYLLSKGKIINFDDLKSRFSLEVVNKEFYKEISQAFTKLVSGLLNLPSTQDKSQINLEFAVRLIGRIIFCWFLREKKSQAGIALMPRELLSLEAVKKNEDYYHKILEPIFFEVLNKQVKSRKDDFSNEPFSSVPYLNGGLFSPQNDDYYKRTNGDLQSQYHNTLVIPDHWFNDFFEILETYNFTIDENTSYDEELSIDPEMLGRIFENLLAEINPETGESARKSTGSYYTPRIIVDYMIDESLLLYLKEKAGIEENKLRSLISYDLEDDKSNPLNEDEKENIAQALGSIKILDPACGSGAFPIGALQKIVFILQQIDQNGQLWFKKQIQNTPVELRKVIEREFNEKNFDYIRKLGIIRENIYGIDIQPIATEISRLRCFLTLVVDQSVKDEEENRGVEPLPNLDFKFVTANSLIGLPDIDGAGQTPLFDDREKIDDLKETRDQYFNASGIEREQLKTEFVLSQKRLVDQLIKEHGFMGVAKAELTQKLTDWEPFSHKTTSWFDPDWMFGIKDGFDVVIANPPYVSTKGISEQTKNVLEQQFGFSDDLYSHFYFKGIELCKELGVLTYITSKTFWTIQTKKNLRELILRNNLVAIYDTDNPFESVMVDTSVILVQKGNHQRGKIKFLNSNGDYNNPNVLLVERSIYENAVNKVIFRPSPINLAIYSKYNNQVRTLMDHWWPMINTSKNISKYMDQLEEYRKNLKVGDITLLGLITDGGQGLATANNGKYIGVLSTSKESTKVHEARNNNFIEFVQKQKILDYGTDKAAIKKFLTNLSEEELRKLFDSIKEKYGINTFGKGFIYRLVNKNEIKNPDTLTQDEEENGIETGGTFVPYEKGDRDGNKWYLRTPFYIDWSKKNVTFLKENSGNKGEGMPVFRNPQFYFKAGFSWNLINGTRTSNDLKFKITIPAVNDMAANKLSSLMDNVTNKYIATICNSKFINTYTENFINFTVNFPHNSTRQIPIIIPTSKQVLEFENIFDRAFAIKVEQFDGKITENVAEQKLKEIQKELDGKVLLLYGLT